MIRFCHEKASPMATAMPDPARPAAFDAKTLARAFPSGVRPQAEVAACKALNWVRTNYRSHPFPVRVSGETLLIPQRIHFAGFGLDAPVRSIEARMAHCFFTRSTNGYERQRALATILTLNEPWSIPFVVALIGEYVIEILDDIAAALPLLDRAIVGQFLHENPTFHRLTQARVVSYWDANYRARYRPQDYVGFALIEALASMARDQGAAPMPKPLRRSP